VRGVEASHGLTAKVISDKIADFLATLRSKAEEPLSISFSNINFDILYERLNISPGRSLVTQGNHVDRVAESITQGGETYMTSQDMHRHLNMLENLVPKSNEAGVRLWIDAIFFRMSAMLSDSKRMVLNIEQHIPSVDISVPGQTRPSNISGTVDYAALATDPLTHDGT